MTKGRDVTGGRDVDAVRPVGPDARPAARDESVRCLRSLAIAELRTARLAR